MSSITNPVGSAKAAWEPPLDLEMPNSGAGQPADILVVDDSPTNLLVLVGMLNDRGYKVRPVPGGKMALLAARRDPPDLILLDINMPEMNGYQVCEHLKADDRLKGIPVIFISGLTEPLDKVKAFAIGGVDYITKPFQMAELHARVETHLKLRRLHVALEETNSRLEQRVAERSAVAESRAERLRVFAQMLTRAEQQERRRLALVLHDHIQQLVVAAKMRIELAASDSRRGDLKSALEQAAGLLAESLAAMRSLTVELSPPILQEQGLMAALEWLARHFTEKHGLAVRLDGDRNGVDLSEAARDLMFQAVKELLFNVVKHARVNHAQVTLRRGGETMEATVQDTGKGCDPAVLLPAQPPPESMGLFSIRQRLEMLGGDMEVRSAPGQGTRVTVRVPLTPSRAPLASPESVGPGGGWSLPPETQAP